MIVLYYDTNGVPQPVDVTDGAVNVTFVDETGVSFGIKQIDGKMRISSMPYLYDISEGNVPGHTIFERLGYNADIDIVEEDLWGGGGSYVFPVSAQQMEITSSSAEDDPDKGAGVPGTGIHIVTLYYLTDTFVEKSEDITLDGTGVVTTTGVDIYRVQSLKAKIAGTGGMAAGNIIIRNLSDTPVYSQISAGQSRSRNSIYTVPKDKVLYVTSLFGGCSCVTASTAVITLRAKYDHDSMSATTIFLPHAEIIVGSGAGGFYRPFELPIRISEGVDLKCSAITTANNTAVSVGIRGWLE